MSRGPERKEYWQTDAQINIDEAKADFSIVEGFPLSRRLTSLVYASDPCRSIRHSLVTTAYCTPIVEEN